MPSSTSIAHNFIVNCGEENLCEYYGKNNDDYDIPQEYTSLHRAIINQPIFSGNFNYILKNTPKDFHWTRLAILIKDNIRCQESKIIPLTVPTKGTESSFCANHTPGGTSTYVFRFFCNLCP